MLVNHKVKLLIRFVCYYLIYHIVHVAKFFLKSKVLAVTFRERQKFLMLYLEKKDINDYFVHQFLVYHGTEGTKNLSSNWFSLMGEFPV